MIVLIFSIVVVLFSLAVGAAIVHQFQKVPYLDCLHVLDFSEEDLVSVSPEVIEVWKRDGVSPFTMANLQSESVLLTWK